MQHWWEEQEARLGRLESPFSLGLTLLQRLTAADLPQHLALPVAHGLATVHLLTADLVKLTDSLLLCKAGDAALCRAHLATIDTWVDQMLLITEALRGPLDQLLAALAWEPEPTLGQGARPGPQAAKAGVGPQERAKLDGRYAGMHYLDERLDLQLEAVGMNQETRQGLARALAEVYDALLSLGRSIQSLSKEPRPRRKEVAELLLDTGATLHLKLAVRHLSIGRPTASGPVTAGLKLWLRLAALEEAFS